MSTPAGTGARPGSSYGTSIRVELRFCEAQIPSLCEGFPPRTIIDRRSPECLFHICVSAQNPLELHLKPIKNPPQTTLPAGSFWKTNPPKNRARFFGNSLHTNNIDRFFTEKSVGSFGSMARFFRLTSSRSGAGVPPVLPSPLFVERASRPFTSHKRPHILDHTTIGLRCPEESYCPL